METAFIYTLSDPRSGSVRYVGKTFDIVQRLKDHLKIRGNNHKKNWVQSLKKSGLKPVLEVVEIIVGERQQWEDAERFWIESFRQFGFDLTNLQQGGGSGARHAQSTKDKMSAAHKGKIKSESHRLKLSQAGRGKPMLYQTRVALKKANTGRKKTAAEIKILCDYTHSAESRRKIGLKSKGRKFSVEIRKRISDARRKFIARNPKNQLILL